MTDLTDLTNNGAIEGEDLLLMYSQDNAATRTVSFNVLKKAVPTIESVTYVNPILTIAMTDGTEFTVDLT